ncbi:hypothetical protein [Micromonospora echinospora]|uniref:hypothetical protein n=1 Tax=Micromonospora echinospora TaxID=1877 RepID=UPI003670E866
MPETSTADELVALALEVSEEGARAGQLPVGAVVVTGEDVVGRAYTQERAQGRRLVHADLLAMGVDQFRRYAATASSGSLRRYAESMAALG